jgi:hypothetical protein
VIRALCWKEYREQRGVWLVMVAMTVLLLAGLAAFQSPAGADWTRLDSRVRESLVAAALAMAVTYGLVCGSMALAGEREGRTLVFLDTLTGQRAPVWRAKALAGAALTLAQVLVLTCLVLPFGPDLERGGAGTLALIPLLALDAFAWGLAASALVRSAFGAALVGAAFLTLTWMVTGLLVWAWPAAGLVARVVLAVGAVVVSHRVFCESDRRRLPITARARRRAAAGEVSSRRVLIWLTWRQARLEAVIVLVAALLLGVLVPMVDHSLATLVLLLVGAVCGAAVFADEQEGGAFRFVGDQRLPPGRVWRVKALCWFAVAVAAAVLVLLGFVLSYLRKHAGNGETRRLMEDLLGGEMPPVGYRIAQPVMALVYGFAAGQLAGLLSRRRLPALVGGFAVAAGLAGVWIPSLLLGGLPLWQLLGPPVVLLAAGRLVMWWWASDRLWTLRPVTCLVGCSLLVSTWIGVCLWYRVAEVPDVGPPFDRREFANRLSEAGRSEAGQLIRDAARGLVAYEKRVTEQMGPPPQPKAAPPAEPPEGEQTKDVPGVSDRGEPPPPEGAGDRQITYHDLLGAALEKGWPKDNKELGRWLDRLFAGEWVGEFRKAAAAPPGLVVNPRDASISTLAPELQGCREAATLFTGRAVQLQARGEHAAALDHLLVVLGLSRQVGHLTPLFHHSVGQAMEQVALGGLERWLTDLSPRAPLLRRALAALKRHEEERPPLADAVKAEYYVLYNNLDVVFSPAGNFQSRRFALARQMPWEKERETRIINAAFASALRAASRPFWQKGEAEPSSREIAHNYSQAVWVYLMHAGLNINRFREGEARAVCTLRAARLQTALALYQVEKGKPAARLEDLVPHYLDKLPLDPFSGQPFRYRISKGERIVWTDNSSETAGAEPPRREVSAGQGVLWSVGPDRRDDGGLRQVAGIEGTGADMIFLVPQWPKR